MNIINYNELYKNLISNINKSNKPKLLLHCCCGPCSTAVLERVLPYFSVTLFYFNPNITNESEYYLRENELKKLVQVLNNKIQSKNLHSQSQLDISKLNTNINSTNEIKLEEINDLSGINEIKFIATKFEPTTFLNISKGYENETEGGIRCNACCALRLNEAATFAKKNNFDFFCSTLSVSPYKNAKILNEIGFQLQNELGINYLPNDFKKNNGFLRSVELSKLFNLYRQNYCGCEYSKQNVSAK